MTNINQRFVSEENSNKGRPKVHTHKWECFEKLRIYERLGTPHQFEQYKEIYDMLQKSIIMDKLREDFTKDSQSNVNNP